jgi:nucleoprotein TPR
LKKKLNAKDKELKDLQTFFQTEATKNAKAVEDSTKRLNEEKAISMDLRKKLGESGDLQNRFDQSTAKIAALNQEMTGKEKLLATLSAEIQKLQQGGAALDKFNKEAERLQGEVKQRDQTLATLREDLRKQVEDGLEVRRTITDVKRQLEAKTLEAATLSTQIAERDKEVERSKRQLAAKEESVEHRYDTDVTVPKPGPEVSEEQGELQMHLNLRNENVSLLERIKSLDSDLSLTSSERGQLKETLAKVEVDVEELRALKADQEALVADLRSQATKAQERYESEIVARKAQEAKAVSFERHYQLVQHKLSLNAQHDKENDKLRVENESLSKNSETVQEELRSLRTEVEKVKAESEVLKRDQRGAQDKFEQSLKRQVEFKDSEIQDERKMVESLRASVTRIQASNKELQGQLDVVKPVGVNSTKEIRALERQLRTAKTQVEEARAEALAKVTELKTLREKFDAEKKKTAQLSTDKVSSDSKARNIENELVKYRQESMRLTQTVPTPSATPAPAPDSSDEDVKEAKRA